MFTDFNWWEIWIIVGIICAAIEIFTPGFFFMSIGIAAILTGLFSIFIDNILIVLIIFAFWCLLIFVVLKKFGKKLINKNAEETNVFALINKRGIITQTIAKDNTGYVKVGGEEWSSISLENEEIMKGQKVVIRNIEGNKLVVEKYLNK